MYEGRKNFSQINSSTASICEKISVGIKAFIRLKTKFFFPIRLITEIFFFEF
jgi:hypothetical protein